MEDTGLKQITLLKNLIFNKLIWHCCCSHKKIENYTFSYYKAFYIIRVRWQPLCLKIWLKDLPKCQFSRNAFYKLCGVTFSDEFANLFHVWIRHNKTTVLREILNKFAWCVIEAGVKGYFKIDSKPVSSDESAQTGSWIHRLSVDIFQSNRKSRNLSWKQARLS